MIVISSCCVRGRRVALVVVLGVLGAVFVPWVASAAGSEELEVPPFVLPLEETAAAELAEEDWYRLLPTVENDGYMNRYVIESDLGRFTVEGDVHLRLRLREIRALEMLQEITRTDAFVEALGRAALSPVGAALDVVTHPVGTVKRLPGGVARYFMRTVRGVEEVADRATEELQRLAGAEKPEEEAQSESATERPSLLERGVDEAIDYGRARLGYDEQRCAYARRLGVSPYPENEDLDRELGRVAKAAALGGFSTQLLGLPETDALDTLGMLNDLVWEVHPLDLRIRNERLLGEHLGLGEEALEPLFESPHQTPELVTSLVDALVTLDGVDGRAQLVTLAAGADSAAVAELVVRTATFYARFHEHRAPLAELVGGKPVPLAVTAGGDVLIALAVDRLAWTRWVAGLAAQRTEAVRQDHPEAQLAAYLEGGISPVARTNLESLGWEVRDRAFETLAGRPPASP